MSDSFIVKRVPGLFYAVSNTGCYAGHVRIFGVLVHQWNNEVGGQRGENDWAEHRVWSVGFVALHHVSPGKRSANRPGWSLTFAKLCVRKIYGGFSFSWRWADPYRTARS